MKYFKSLQFVNETGKSIENNNVQEINIENALELDVSSQLKTNKKTKGRIKLKIEYMRNKVRRLTTFSKRKIGIMKKAYELAQLTGAQVMLLVGSETGHVYTFATDKLQPMVTSTQGKRLIESCLKDTNLQVNPLGNSKPVPTEDINKSDSSSFVNQSVPNDQFSSIQNANITNCLPNFQSSNCNFNVPADDGDTPPEVLAQPKGTLKKLFCDINKKGNCNMSIKRHKIEKSSCKKILKLEPRDCEREATSNKFVADNSHLSNKFAIKNTNNTNYKFFNNVQNHNVVYNIINMNNNILEDVNVKYNKAATIGLAASTEENLHAASNLDVMIDPVIFNLIQTNVYRDGEYNLNQPITSEAINLITKK